MNDHDFTGRNEDAGGTAHGTGTPVNAVEKDPAAGAENRYPDTPYSWVNAGKEPDGFGQGHSANPWEPGNREQYWKTETGSRYEGAGQGMPEPGQRDRSRQVLAGADGSGNRPDHAKESSARPRWKALIAMALVFGLIAGSTAYAVNRAASLVYPAGGRQQAAGTQEEGSQPAAGAQEEDSQPAPQRTRLAQAGETSGPVSGMSVAEVTANTMPSMVTISTMSVMEMESFFGGSQKYTTQGAGSGIIVGQNETELLIATNNHVVRGASQLSVGFIDESAAEAAVKGTDSSTDLAVIAVKLSDIPDETMDQIKIAVIGDSDALVLGEQIVAIGNALGYGQSVTSGYVSAFNRELSLSDGSDTFTSSDLIQVDAAINAGNSGGALLNMKGELVGINEAKSSMTSSGATVDNVGYAIPINKAEPILEELMNETTRERYSEEEQGYLGVTCANVTREYAQMYGMPEGVCFTSVAEDGPAGEAGIRKGDVLTSFDGKAIKTYEQLSERLTYYKAGESVDVVVLRADNGEYREHVITVVLGSKDVLKKVTGAQTEGDD